MIRRDGPRRSSTALILTPTYKGADLPPWSPSAPAGGWTPATAWAAALDYAEQHDGIYNKHVLATAAYRALLAAVPGIHRADVTARLHGADVRVFVTPKALPPF